jgi:biopolymer transport protein ExbB
MTSKLGQLLQQGGWAMYPIYVCAVLGMVLFLQRLLVFRKIRSRKLPWLRDVLEHVRRGEIDKALSLCASISHPISRVLASALQMHRHRPDRVQSEAERVGRQELDSYERFLPMLSFIAEVAPLLGLLGTVIGMVQMFYGMQGSGMSNVNASALSSGIWKALLTTAGGLIVAAPGLGAHLLLSEWVERFRRQMVDSIEQLLTALPEAGTHHEVSPPAPERTIASTLSQPSTSSPAVAHLSPEGG